MTTLTIDFDCCGRSISIPTAIPEDGSMLHHHATIDTLIMMAEASHDEVCSVV